MSVGRAASIHARLLKRARERGEDFNLVLTRYAIERFLYRLSLAPLGKSLVLKGALLFDLWFDVPHRPTHDADFLGIGDHTADSLIAALGIVCSVVSDDGMEFDAASVATEEIREEARYGGLRAKLLGRLGNARCPLQIDVGYGDAVTPGPETAVYPTLLDDLPAPRLRVYPRATVMAEKLDAIISLGIANSRMKDYFDLHALAREGKVDANVLADAIAATLTRRATLIPAGDPFGLSAEFALDATKRTQWSAFLRKNRLEAPALDVVVAEIRDHVQSPLRQALAQVRRP